MGTTYHPVLVSPPTITPVSMDEVKAHCKAAEFADDDARLLIFLKSAVAHLDGWQGILGRCLVEQTWRQDFDSFSDCMRFQLGPVIDITSIKYDDADGVEQTIDPEDYELSIDACGRPFVRFVSSYSAPTLSSVLPALRVTYRAGVANAGTDPNFTSAVESDIKNAILMMVEDDYDPDADNADAVARLLGTKRKMTV